MHRALDHYLDLTLSVPAGIKIISKIKNEPARLTNPKSTQLVSYIAHAAPATRRPAHENEPFLRPEIGFTPKWFHEALGFEFGESWHTNPEVRRDSIAVMGADGYTAQYANLPDVAYIDMGIEPDLRTAKTRFPGARRALMYTPMDVREKTIEMITSDFEHIARDYGPCDIVLADIDYGVPDERVRDLIDLCHRLSDKYSNDGDMIAEKRESRPC